MRSFIFLSAALLFLPCALALRGSKCLLLALEGGGTKGAYQAGVFESLVELLRPEDVQYDVVSGTLLLNLGVSVGILNGLMIASHKRGDEKEAARKLTELWHTIKSDDIFVQWPFPGLLQGFYSKPSFLDNRPEFQLVTRLYQQNGGKLHRGISIGIVDAQTGKFFAANGDVGHEKVPLYVTASSSVPAIFNYIVEGNRTLIDGFTVDNLNLRGGIKECQKVVGDDARITVDIILAKPLSLPPQSASTLSTIGLYQRANDINAFHKNWFYLLDVMKAFPKINWRYVVSPEGELPNYPFVPLVVFGVSVEFR